MPTPIDPTPRLEAWDHGNAYFFTVVYANDTFAVLRDDDNSECIAHRRLGAWHVMSLSDAVDKLSFHAKNRN